MTKSLLVIADADCIVAQSFAEDSHHETILDLVQKLDRLGGHILFPSTAIAEAITTLQRKFSNPQLAASTLELFTDPSIDIESVDQETLREASKLFDPSSSKHNTLFDCIVATVAKKYNADAILSFDDWYPKLGFKLAIDLLDNLPR